MRYSLLGLGLGLLNPARLVQAQSTVTVKVPVGTCAPGAYQGTATGSGSGGGSGAGSGSAGGQPTLGETVDSSYGSYTLDGAFDAGSSGYILDGASTTTSNMTLEYCASFCKGTPYFALQNGNECICGSSAPSGNAVDISEYGCATVAAGDPSECAGSLRYGVVYFCASCSSTGSGPSTVLVYTTTNSQGSTYVTSTTSALPASFNVATYTTTDAQGSTYVTTSTSTPAIPSVTVVTTAETVVTTNSDGSVYTTVQTQTISSTVTPTSSTVASGPTIDARTCPGAGGIYVDGTTGLKYEVTCGADYPGEDLATPHVASLAACAAACSNYVPDQTVLGGAACVAASYGEGNVGGNCYLKATVTTVNYGNGGFVAMRLISYAIPTSASSESVSAPTSGPTMTGVESVSSPENGPTTTPVASGGSGSTSIEDGGTATTSGASSTGTTAASSTGTVDPATAAFPCPTYDGKQYIDAANVVYTIECAANYPGYDLPAVHVETLEQCISACDKYTPDPSVADGKPCIGASWGIGNVGGNCYLKFEITDQVDHGNTGFDSFHVYGTGAGASLSVVAGASSTDAAGASDTAAASSTIAAASDTGAAASTTDAATSSDIGAASSTVAANPEPTTADPICIQDNHTIYTNTFGNEWEIQCSRQLDGNNGQPVHADTFVKCLDFCSIVEGCVAVTWLQADDPKNTNCYPYTSFRFYSNTAITGGLHSGVSRNGATDNTEVNGALCPAQDAKMYTDYFKNIYTIGCGHNLGGTQSADLPSTVTTTLMGCMTYCSLYNTCIGVAFTGAVIPGTQNHNCYPKYGVGSPQVAAGTSYAVLNTAANGP